MRIRRRGFLHDDLEADVGEHRRAGEELEGEMRCNKII